LSENAPGQLLGFVIQFPRALCHLLKATPGCTVCIEVHGDVATVRPDGAILAEEDKSSIHSNPITDKSTDLWKTMSNWVNSVNAGELDINNTTFILYRNKTGRRALAELFHDTDSIETANTAIDAAIKKLGNITADHEIWQYYKNTLIDNRTTLAKILKNFELESGEGSGFSEVEKAIIGLHVPKSQITSVANSLSGWLVRSVTDKISEKKDARITWEDFHIQFTTLFDRARRLELIDFTLTSPLSKAEISQKIRIKPNFIKQIELIDATEDDVLEAVTDYMKAKVNRSRWIEDEILDEEIAADFEDKLQRFWKSTKTTHGITNKQLSKEDRGKLIFNDCIVRQETIRGESPPPSTIAGTYHALADTPSLGWHDDWKASLKK